MNKQDIQIVPFPQERRDGARAVADRLRARAKTLPQEEQDILWTCVKLLKIIAPGPRVNRMIGEFLIDLADEVDKQDKIYGTDSNSENQLTMVVKKKEK